MIGRFRSPTVVSSCLAILALSACASTTSIDGESTGTETFDIQSAPMRVAEGIQALDRRMEALPDQMSERFAFDEERAVRVDGEGFQVSGDTVSYIMNEWLPQVTGTSTREEERAARAEEELRTQVASIRSRNLKCA